MRKSRETKGWRICTLQRLIILWLSCGTISAFLTKWEFLEETGLAG